jgi:hypothetical protein
MAVEGGLRVIFNHIPQTKIKLMAGGRETRRQMMEQVASEVRQAAPYQGLVRVEIETAKDEATVSVGPWWIGFLELGSATHASRPFLEPAAERVFRTLVPRMKIVGSSL